MRYEMEDTVEFSVFFVDELVHFVLIVFNLLETFF